MSEILTFMSMHPILSGVVIFFISTIIYSIIQTIGIVIVNTIWAFRGVKIQPSYDEKSLDSALKDVVKK
jgi:hypothetical protein